jgi:predicted RNase H-like HicB family nuclease
MFKYNAIDKNGIPRVWGTGETLDEAKKQCKLALKEYCEEKNKNPNFFEIYFVGKE